MQKELQIWVAAMIAAFMVLICGNLSASDNFVKVRLPEGISIEIPKNWRVLSGNQKITLDSAVESVLDLAGIEEEGSELPFAANHYDDQGNAIGILNIRYYPQLELTQTNAQAATNNDISELDAALKENMIKTLKKSGITVTSWNGTQKTSINGITAFLTEYHRKALRGEGEYKVKLVRVFSGNKSFTLTVSYHVTTDFLLRPITERIINSLNLEGINNTKNIIMSPYGITDTQSTPVMKKLYGEQWKLTLFLSFLFTWGVGLTPPLLIRFEIIRRQIAKVWSIGIVALFWVFNLILFEALGSQSKRHTALILVMFVSYWILRAENKKKTEDGILVIPHKKENEDEQNE